MPKRKIIEFEGIKINKEIRKKVYVLNSKNHFRAGNEFEDIDDVERNKGNN